MTHLRAYCDQLVGVGRDEALLMLLLSRSLCEENLGNGSPPKIPGSGPIGMPWPRNLLISFLTMWKSFLIGTLWKRKPQMDKGSRKSKDAHV